MFSKVFWLFQSLFLLFSINNTVFAQKTDSLKQELAYWYKHPNEWKAYKRALLQKQQDYQKHLDSVKSYKKFLHSLQLIYDGIADRVETADSLINLYTGQKQALLKQKKRNKHHLVFKIQVQLAKTHEIDVYALPNTMLTIEKIEKGQKRYMIGVFAIYEEVQSFAEILTNAGAKVYVVAYKNEHRLKNFAEYID